MWDGLMLLDRLLMNIIWTENCLVFIANIYCGENNYRVSIIKALNE